MPAPTESVPGIPESAAVGSGTGVRWPGFFLTLEGPEGCGKSTQAALLAERLDQRGLSVVVTREPGGTALGDRLRDLLLDPASREMTQRTELLLYEASRAQHVEQLVLPALQRGAVVLCDRFTDSSTAYQSYGLGLPRDSVQTLNAFATGGVTPDLTVVLDVPARLGLQRATAGEGPDRIEDRTLEFHERVRQGFLSLAAAEPARVRVLDGRADPLDLCKAILQELATRWPPLAKRGAPLDPPGRS